MERWQHKQHIWHKLGKKYNSHHYINSLQTSVQSFQRTRYSVKSASDCLWSTMASTSYSGESWWTQINIYARIRVQRPPLSHSDDSCWLWWCSHCLPPLLFVTAINSCSVHTQHIAAWDVLLCVHFYVVIPTKGIICMFHSTVRVMKIIFSHIYARLYPGFVRHAPSTCVICRQNGGLMRSSALLVSYILVMRNRLIDHVDFPFWARKRTMRISCNNVTIIITLYSSTFLRHLLRQESCILDKNLTCIIGCPKFIVAVCLCHRLHSEQFASCWWRSLRVGCYTFAR